MSYVITFIVGFYTGAFALALMAAAHHDRS